MTTTRRGDDDQRKVHAEARHAQDQTLCGRKYTRGWDDEPLVAARHEEAEVDCARCRKIMGGLI